jgi:hypothetical protein
MQPHVPEKFALKELISPKPFPLGTHENIRDYLPLNEAAIQRYMRHSSIVDTYWADVRFLHPDTNRPLDLGVTDLEGAWTPLDHLSDVEKTYEEAAEHNRPDLNRLQFKSIKLQMRIAMEHCDLGVLSFEKPGCTLLQVHSEGPCCICVVEIGFDHRHHSGTLMRLLSTSLLTCYSCASTAKDFVRSTSSLIAFRLLLQAVLLVTLGCRVSECVFCWMARCLYFGFRSLL